LIHVLRRNLDVNILMFNNRIYGLTKGQYSPTSEVGKVTKSTPSGSVDHPFHPIALALGADSTFVARTVDVEARHLQETIRRAHALPHVTTRVPDPDRHLPRRRAPDLRRRRERPARRRTPENRRRRSRRPLQPRRHVDGRVS